ncbi:response regulator [bacterium]|nr:response regulator [bacterium]
MRRPWDGTGGGEPPKWTSVLIVDDNDRYARALGDQMTAGGAAVERALNAADGIKRLQNDAARFDGIITDISMETQISGLRILRRARKLGFKGEIAVATTGLDTPLGYLFNRLFLGVLMRADYLIPKRPIKQRGTIDWIHC